MAGSHCLAICHCYRSACKQGESLRVDVETHGLAQVDLYEQKCKMKHDAKDYNGDADDAVRPDGDES